MEGGTYLTKKYDGTLVRSSNLIQHLMGCVALASERRVRVLRIRDSVKFPGIEYPITNQNCTYCTFSQVFSTLKEQETLVSASISSTKDAFKKPITSFK